MPGSSHMLHRLHGTTTVLLYSSCYAGALAKIIVPLIMLQGNTNGGEKPLEQ